MTVHPPGGEGEMAVVVEDPVGLSTVIGPWYLQRVGVVNNIAAQRPVVRSAGGTVPDGSVVVVGVVKSEVVEEVEEGENVAGGGEEEVVEERVGSLFCMQFTVWLVAGGMRMVVRGGEVVEEVEVEEDLRALRLLRR